jgi:hypothetical protein
VIWNPVGSFEIRLGYPDSNGEQTREAPHHPGRRRLGRGLPQPEGTAGRSGDATVNVDSLGVDSTGARVDSSAAQAEKARRSIPQDTLGPSNIDTTRADTTAR